MSSTNWKNLGRKQGGNMKHNRNVKVDKAFYLNGKWDTIYTPDNIKRLAYYNIDLPHIVGIGTNKPFSKLSFGDSSASGNHVSGIITPGKVTAIAMHEKSINKSIDGGNETLVEGQDFTGFSYVTNLRSVRRVISNTDAKGIGIFANKDKVDEDTGLKTDKATLYVTDDGFVSIGGKPTQLNVIDGGATKILPSAGGGGIGVDASTVPVVTGPNIMMDVSGSIHVNGFINFLKNGSEEQNQQTDNPAGQLTYNNTTQQLEFATDPVGKTTRACPDGAIWVGWDKEDNATSLSSLPRLYIQRGGTNTRILTEFDQDLIEGSSTTSGITWAGSNENADTAFYVFRQPGSKPNNSIINTYIGRTGTSGSAVNFDTGSLPRLQNAATNDPSPSALSIVGNLSVFDFTTGGTNGNYLSGANTDILKNFKSILPSDIYTKEDTVTSGVDQKELGTIYMDRHLMIGGMNGIVTGTNTKPKFETFTAAIDISGGIIKKPIMRVLTGNNKGSLVTNSDCQDSIIIGNTNVGDITGNNKLSIIFGNQEEIENVNSTIVHGTNNSVNNLTNSLVVGNNLIAGNETTGADVIDGLVALGVGDANLKVDGDDRIVLATKDGNDAAVKALAVDKDGNVKIAKNLEVVGDHVHLEVTELKIQDPTLELNVDGNGTATNFTGLGDNGGLLLKENTGTVTDHKFLWYGNTGDAGEWRTYDAALATGPGTAGSEGVFKSNGDTDVTLKTGNATTGSITITDGANGDITVAPDGNGKIKVGGTSPTITTDGEKDLILDTNDGTNSGSITITDGADGHITVAPNGNGKIKVGGTSPTITTDGTTDLQLDTNEGNGASYIKIKNSAQGSNNTDGDIEIVPAGTGVLLLGGSTPTIQTADGVDLSLKPGFKPNDNSDQKLIIYEDYDENNTKGARFEQDSNNKVNLLISGKLTVDGLIDPTGLILDAVNSAPTDNEVNGKLGLFFDGNKLKFKTKATDGTVTTSEVAVGNSETSGGSGAGGGGTSTGGTIAFANDLALTGTNQLVFQKQNNDTDLISNGTANQYLKTGSATAAPAFATIQYSEINGRLQLGTSSTTALKGDASTTDISEGNNLYYTDVRVKTALGSDGGTGGVGGTVETIMLKQNNSNDRTITVGKASGAGQATNLVIKGGEAKSNNGGGGDYNGGDVKIEGGSATGTGKQGNVFISAVAPDSNATTSANTTGGNVFISADNISTDLANIANGTTLAVKNTNGWAELILQCSTTAANTGNNETDNHYNYIGFKNQKLKFCGDTGFDDDCVLTIEKSPKGTITLGEGTGTNGQSSEVMGTPTIRTARNNQNLVLDPNGSGKIQVGGSSPTIEAKPQTAGNDGKSLTIQAGNGVSDTPASDQNGGNIVLTPGDKAESGNDGYVEIQKGLKVGTGLGSYPSIGKHVLTVDGNGKVEIGAVSNAGGAYSTVSMESDLNSLGSASQNDPFPIAMIAHGTGEGKNLTIKAQNAGGINKSGGNLILSGGLLTANTGGNATTSTNGKVVIGSSLKLNSLNGPASGSAPLQVNASGDVSVGSYYSDTNLSNLATGTSIAFDNPTNADGGNLTITAQGGNGTSKNGGNLVLSGGAATTGGANGNVTVNSQLVMGNSKQILGDVFGNILTTDSSGTSSTVLDAKGGSNDPAEFTGNVTGNCSGTAATVTGATQSNITSLGALTGLNFNKDANRIIKINSTTASGDGKDLTIQAQNAFGSIGHGGGSIGYNGGNLILEPGTGSNAGGVGLQGTSGSVVIKNGFKVESSIGGSLPSSGNSNVLVVDSNGNVTVNSISSASGTYGDSDVETLLQGNLSTATTNNDFNIKMTDRGNNTDAKKLIITAQGFDSGETHEGNGGDLQLSGGPGNGSNKTDGVVNITSGLKISSLSTSDGPLEVTSGVVGVGSSVDEHLDDLGDGTSAFTIKMTNNTNGDGADFTIQGQQGKASTNSHGGDLRLIGGSQTGTGKKQGNVIVSGDNVDWISDSNGNQFKLLGGDGYAEIILEPNDTNGAGDNHFNFISYKTRQLKFLAEASSSKTALTLDHTSPGQLTLGEGSHSSVVARIKSASNKNLELEAASSKDVNITGTNIQLNGNVTASNNLTVSGTITASNNTVTATVGGANLSVGLNVISSDNDNKIVNLPNPSTTTAGAIIQMVSSSSNKYEVQVLGNSMKINSTTCTDGSGTATNEVEIATNSFVICICNGTDEWNLFANGIRLTPDSV